MGIYVFLWGIYWQAHTEKEITEMDGEKTYSPSCICRQTRFIILFGTSAFNYFDLLSCTMGNGNVYAD